MGLPVLDNVLGCISVRTGALVIGWLSLINSTLTLVKMIFGMFVYFQLDDRAGLVHAWAPTATEYLNGTGETTLSEESAERAEHALQVVIIVVALIILAKFTVDLLYLIGVCKKNTCLMSPMIVLYGLGCLFMIITVSLLIFGTVAVGLVKLGNGAQDVQLGMLFLITFILGIAGALAVYCFLIMYSYYRIVDRQQKSHQGAILNDYVIDKEHTLSPKEKEFSTNYVRM